MSFRDEVMQIITRMRNSVEKTRLLLLRHTSDNLSGIKQAEVLTYEDSVRYFVNSRPDDERIVKGALLQRPKDTATLVIWLFLDENNLPLSDEKGNPYGRKLLAARLDEELREWFGDKDVLIVE